MKAIRTELTPGQKLSQLKTGRKQPLTNAETKRRAVVEDMSAETVARVISANVISGSTLVTNIFHRFDIKDTAATRALMAAKEYTLINDVKLTYKSVELTIFCNLTIRPDNSCNLITFKDGGSFHVYLEEKPPP